jgi:hypothetical protein
MALHVPLARLQRWMQAVIVDPAEAEAAPRARPAAAEVPPERIADVVRPSARLTAVERVGIYHGMYLLRMEEALAADHPGLKHLLGEAAFFDLVRDYVQEHPSRHFSLNRLGDHLPGFVARRPGLPRRAFCHDLARLERALALVFDAPETPALPADAVASVPPERWEDARLVPIAAFALLALRYPVGEYLDSVSEAAGHRHPVLRRRAAWSVVYRRDHSVWRRDLSRAGYTVLSRLEAGHTVGDAITAAMRLRGAARAREHEIFRLFRDWTAAGLFQRIDW